MPTLQGFVVPPTLQGLGRFPTLCRRNRAAWSGQLERSSRRRPSRSHLCCRSALLFWIHRENKSGINVGNYDLTAISQSRYHRKCSMIFFIDVSISIANTIVTVNKISRLYHSIALKRLIGPMPVYHHMPRLHTNINDNDLCLVKREIAHNYRSTKCKWQVTRSSHRISIVLDSI